MAAARARPVDLESERAQKGDSARPKKYDYWPGGRLRIEVLEARLLRSMWSETDTRPLERILGQVIVGNGAAVAKRQRLKHDAEQRRSEKLQRERQERQAR
jgi:hypothetical protein